MCTRACLDFARSNLHPDEIRGRSVLEVGSLDVNGTVRPIVERYQPRSYTGVDVEQGPGVDEICDATALVPRFGFDAFDVVISTEMIEHVRDWRRVISQFKQVLKPGGILLVTTRSRGFHYHAFPHDYWRYEPDDVRAVFADFEILCIENDPAEPGVLFKVRKPSNFHEIDISRHELYSIITQRRVIDISNSELAGFSRRRAWRELLRMPERGLRRLRKKIWG